MIIADYNNYYYTPSTNIKRKRAACIIELIATHAFVLSLSVSHTLPPAVRMHPSSIERTIDTELIQHTTHIKVDSFACFQCLIVLISKPPGIHIHTYTHHVANLFRNIYTPTFSSSICVCSLSCILINHSPLYTHHTPAYTHTRYAIPSSILLRIIILILILCLLLLLRLLLYNLL